MQIDLDIQVGYIKITFHPILMEKNYELCIFKQFFILDNQILNLTNTEIYNKYHEYRVSHEIR